MGIGMGTVNDWRRHCCLSRVGNRCLAYSLSLHSRFVGTFSSRKMEMPTGGNPVPHDDVVIFKSCWATQQLSSATAIPPTTTLQLQIYFIRQLCNGQRNSVSLCFLYKTCIPVAKALLPSNQRLQRQATDKLPGGAGPWHSTAVTSFKEGPCKSTKKLRLT